jgi:hypothetical protein
MTAEELRKVSGGVIGHFTPKERQINVENYLDKTKAGDNVIGLKVPAGRFVVGAYVKNPANDLVGGNVGVKVGGTAVLAAGDVKGTGLMAILAEPIFVAEATDATLTVSADLTKGNLTVGVIYA